MGIQMVVIGSTAIRHYYPDFPRDPNDVDYVVESKRGYVNADGIEYHLNPVLLKYQSEGYCLPSFLLNLKISHLFWDINWEKHLFDVQFLLKKGHTVDIEMINAFRAYWDTVHAPVRRSNLESNKEKFFTNAVNEDANQHDFLHTLLNPIPMYTKLLKDGCEVELDESKWWQLSFEDKLEVIREETMVMAYERYPDFNYQKAFVRQLKQNIIKHFPKYIAVFGIINYICLERINFNYQTKIKNGLQKSV